MNKILCEIKWEYVIAILSLLSSIIISVGTLLTSMNNEKKQRLVNIITSNRIEWIQKLKEYASFYIGMVSYHYERNLPEDISTYMNGLFEIASKIKFHMNFIGDADNQIFKELDLINVAYEKFFAYKRLVIEFRGKKNPFNLIGFFQNNFPELFDEFFKEIINDMKPKPTNFDELMNNLKKIENQPEEVEKLFRKQISLIDTDMKKTTKIIKYSYLKLQILIQIYLKTEWERVKKETGSGSLIKYEFDEIFENYKKDKQQELLRLERLLMNIDHD